MKPRPELKIAISIPIPRAVHEFIQNIRYQAKKAAFKMRPFRCGVCNAAMTVRRPQYEHIFDNGKRLLIENYPTKAPSICRSCLLSELESKQWTPRFTYMHTAKYGDSGRENYRFWSTKKCAITGKAVRSYKDVEIRPYVDMMFCTTAWNYEYVSKEAVIEAIEKGRIKTSIWGIYKNKTMAPMNEKGLFINERGELL